jgi:hypothetical protein
MAKKVLSALSLLIITSLVAGIATVYAQTSPSEFPG